MCACIVHAQYSALAGSCMRCGGGFLPLTSAVHPLQQCAACTQQYFYPTLLGCRVWGLGLRLTLTSRKKMRWPISMPAMSSSSVLGISSLLHTTFTWLGNNKEEKPQEKNAQHPHSEYGSRLLGPGCSVGVSVLRAMAVRRAIFFSLCVLAQWESDIWTIIRGPSLREQYPQLQVIQVIQVTASNFSRGVHVGRTKPQKVLVSWP